MDSELLKCATLAFINDVRSEHSLPRLLELPNGEPKSSTRCVLAHGLRELGGTCDGIATYVETPLVDARHELPGPVMEFVDRFDNGDFPELELED